MFAQDKSAIGPTTEERFPKLQLPAGFQATLFACDPLIEYPSVIAVGPKPGSMFVAQDYMSGLGYNSPRRSEVKLVEDTDGDGYADRSTLFAGDFNSIQGLTWHDGSVYVMHSPLLTSLRDEDGDGKADTRRDLLSGLGLSPKENPNLLHCANGVVAGHDGWLVSKVTPSPRFSFPSRSWRRSRICGNSAAHCNWMQSPQSRNRIDQRRFCGVCCKHWQRGTISRPGTPKCRRRSTWRLPRFRDRQARY